MKQIAVLLIVLGALACADKTETSSASVAVPKPVAADPSFNLVRAWQAKEVVIKSPSTTFTMTPKNAPSWIAVELTLTQDAATPVRANYSELTLIDAAGGRHKSMFSYPIDATAISDDRATITFTDDPSKLINGTLSEMGGRLIAVFESPADTAGLKLEIPGEPPLNLPLAAP
jgi:hypothetical protein